MGGGDGPRDVSLRRLLCYGEKPTCISRAFPWPSSMQVLREDGEGVS